MNRRSYRDLSIWMVAVVVIIGNAAASHFNIDRMVRLDRAALHTRAVQAGLNDLLSELTDAETGQRGYLLTGRADYLQPFREAERKFDPKLDHLRALVGNDPAATARLAEVEAHGRAKFAEMRRVLAVFDPKNPAAAIREVGDGEGKNEMDAARAAVQAMLAAEDEQLARRTQAADDNIRLARVTSLIGAGIAVAVVLLASSVVQRELDRRRKANRELRESEGRFRVLAESMPQMVWMTRPDGSHVYFNQKWYDYTGLTPAESYGHEWSRPLHPDDRERSKVRWRHATDTGEPYEIKYRFRRRDGGYRWFLGRAEPVRDGRGAVTRWLGTCTDIDEQVRAAQQLQESEAYLRSVLDNSPDCVKILDTAGNLLDMNGPGRAAMEIDDFDHLRGCPWPSLWPDEAREATRRALAAAAQGRVARFAGPCPTAKGTPRHWDVIVAPIPDAAGVVQRIISVSRDVTDQKATEERLHESLSQLRQLTEGLPQLVWATTPAGSCDYLSRQWVDYTGRPAADQLGYEWLATLHPDDRTPTATAWEQSVAETRPFHVEYRLRRGDGIYRWFAVRGIPVFDSRGAVARWYGSCTDIDDRKQQADTLERLVGERTTELTATSEKLKASNDELDKFASVASHDLQEPLRKIQAFGDRLRKYTEGLDEAGRDYLTRLLDSAGRMRRLIEDLLRFSRVTSKTRTPAPVRLNRVVADVLEDLAMQVQRTGGRVTVGDLPTVTADMVQMRQLFQNLIGNALKFARPDVPPVVSIDATRSPTGWRIAVADNGIGFDAAEGERVFDPFHRLHGRTKFEGTGLGLAICRKIVTRHGASIVADSTPGVGTTFLIDWPNS